MNRDSERLVRNERRNSLSAFLRAIKFRKPRSPERAERAFAQPHQQARQHGALAEENSWVRSAN